MVANGKFIRDKIPRLFFGRINTSNDLTSFVHDAHNLKGLIQGDDITFSAAQADLVVDVRDLEAQTNRVGEVVVISTGVGQGEVQLLLLLPVLLVHINLLRAPERLADLDSMHA